MAVRFSKQMIPNLIQPFWAAWQGGEFLTDAAALGWYASSSWVGVVCARPVGSAPAGAFDCKAATFRSRSAKSSALGSRRSVSRSAPSLCG